MIGVDIQSQTRPAKMFEIVSGQRLLSKIRYGGLDAWMIGTALQREEHERRWAGDGFERGAENAAIAVVDAAVVQGAIEQQVQTLADARMLVLTGAAQRQARPGGRLDPGERALRPRPTNQLAVNIVDILLVVAVCLPALACQQCGSRLIQARILFAQDRLHEKNQRRGPDCFRSAAFQTIRAISHRALT